MNLLRYLENDFLIKPIKSKDYALGLLSGFIDAEGYVNHGEIVVTQKNKDVLDNILRLCKLLGLINLRLWCSKSFKSRNLIWRLRITTKLKELEHASIKIERRYRGQTTQS